ncbi:MAG TPA: hypothetical protein VFA83_11530 [Acidimicrobiales bacterium]|nr:hypothetical protein [Acidimicrobiales bacterium]
MLLKRRLVIGATAAVAAIAGGLGPVRALSSTPPMPDMTVAANRATEPVVLTGANFPTWAAPQELTAKAPTVAGAQCLGGQQDACTHNHYDKPEVATGDTLGRGTPIDKLLGYRWDSRKRDFVQIPFQVDEVATRYLSNNASGFAFYSETDQHPAYVFDQERFRWTKSDPRDPCHALPDGAPSTPDPVPGLDTNDELSFMASDAGPAAPQSAAVPEGIDGVYKVSVVDPYHAGTPGYVYVMRADNTPHAPKAAFTAANGYVRYLPDADSDTFLYSQSSYGDYGAAAPGPYYDPVKKQCVLSPIKQRRPKDTAWVKTPTYEFRYDGRWLMTQLAVVPKGRQNDVGADPNSWKYGPDLIDQWKARAFQQRPGGTTPCCGYEEEVNNWGGSGILMGYRAGPVRVIRATWGADSSTNNIRTEVFYRDEVRQLDYLRVHVIPPFDGIYSQWDYNAGMVSTYFNPYVPKGVPIDGKNDEVFGNTRMHVGPDGVRLTDGDPVPVVGPQDISAGDPTHNDCTGDPCIDNDIDVPDPTFSGVNAGLNYEEVTGPHGTVVDRVAVKQVTAGTGYTVLAVPYYRDDSCFDDGTGTDPGLHVKGRGVDPVLDSAGKKRVCWTPADGDPAKVKPRDHFWQGDIGTHGLHLEFIADSDNAAQTVPLDEIDSEQRIVVLSGPRANVGEQFGRATEKPLVVVATPGL